MLWNEAAIPIRRLKSSVAMQTSEGAPFVLDLVGSTTLRTCFNTFFVAAYEFIHRLRGLSVPEMQRR